MPRRKTVPNELSPKVIFNVQYHPYHENYDLKDKKQRKDAWFHCHPELSKNGGDALSYIGRNNATDKRSFEQIKEQIEMCEGEEMSFNDALDYIDKRYGSTGHFNANGDIKTREEIDAIRSRIRASKSPVWSAVLSMTPDFANQFVQDKIKGQELLKKIMPTFFKEANFDLENVEWIADYHTNTPNHPHIHINFWEAEPLRLDSKGNRCYHQNKIKLSAIQNFKYNVINFYNKENNLDYLKLRDENRTILRSFLYSSPVKDTILNVAPNFESSSSSFNRLSNEKKEDVFNIIDLILNTYPDFKINHDKYLEEIKKHQQRILETFKLANTKPTLQAKNYSKNRIDDYYNRLGNEVLKTIKQVLKIQKDIEELERRDEAENREIQRIQNSFKDFNEENVSLSSYHDCVKKLNEQGFEIDMLDKTKDDSIYASQLELIKSLKESNDKNKIKQAKDLEKEIKIKKMSNFDVSKYESPNLDRRVLRNYGVDFFSKDVNGKPIIDKNGHINLIKGNFIKFTFVNAKGDIADYYLDKNVPVQKSFPNVLKQLGLSDKAIFNIATKCNFKTFTNDLLFLTSSYNSKWVKMQLAKEKKENQKTKLSFNKNLNSNSKLIHQRKQERKVLGINLDGAMTDLFGAINDETKLLLGYIENENEKELFEKFKERDDGYGI